MTRTQFVALLAVVGLAGCAEPPPDASPRSAGTAAPRPPAAEDPFAPLRDPETGRWRQVVKSPEVAAARPDLFPAFRFPDSELPDADLDELGVRRVETPELEALLDHGAWALVDVRKLADVEGMGRIPGAIHFEYRWEGEQPPPKTPLTRDVCAELLATHAGVVFHCNGPKCVRSFNACIAAVQEWGFSAERVRWYRDGVPGWTRSPLVPAELGADQ